ncbi:MAG: porin [Rhizobiales bacterium]|nr:porin [Rhizobacter sp.]
MNTHKFTFSLLPILALAGADAAAQSVSIYGLLDAYVTRTKSGAGGVKATDTYTNRAESGGMTTSFIGIRGTEDLGDGLTAGFSLASFVRLDTGQPGRSDAVGSVAADPFWSRDSVVFLRGRQWGGIRLGNASTLMFGQSIASNAFGSSTVFSPLVTVTFIGSPLSGGTGWTNQIIYDSPVFGGLSFNLAVSASEGQGGRNTSGRVAYAGDPLAISFAYQQVKKNPLAFNDGTSANNTKSWQLAGSYDFKAVKFWAHVGQIENDGTEAAPLNVRYNVWDLSTSVPVGPGAILAGYARRRTSDAVAPVPAAAPAGNRQRQVLTVGYDYYLSKRTDVYALAMHDRTETYAAPAPGHAVNASATNFSVGVRHQF